MSYIQTLESLTEAEENAVDLKIALELAIDRRDAARLAMREFGWDHEDLPCEQVAPDGDGGTRFEVGQRVLVSKGATHNGRADVFFDGPFPFEAIITDTGDHDDSWLVEDSTGLEQFVDADCLTLVESPTVAELYARVME